MQGNRRVRQMAIIGLTALVLAGCANPAGELDSVQSAPGSDGTFTLYSGRNEELVQPLIDMFEAESGVAVEVRYGDTAELGALLLEAGERTPAQVFLSQDAGALGALSAAGLFMKLPADITEQVPAGFTSADDTWVGLTGRARVVVFDSTQLAADDVPERVESLVAPEWFGRVAAEQGVENMRAKLAFPVAGDPGSIGNVTGAGILAAGAADADALEFLEFLLSPQAQQYFVDETFEYPLVSGVAAPEGLPELQTLRTPELDLSELRTLSETQALLAESGLI